MIIRRLLASVVLCVGTTSLAIAQTAVSSDILSNTTWSLGGSPYTVTTTIRIGPGVQLTIEPGTTIRMASGTSILVEGALVADGTATDLITFTSAAAAPAPGDWNGIEFRNTSNAGSVFDHVKIEYGGGSARDAMLYYTTGAFAVSVTHSEFRHSAKHGLNLRASSVLVENSRFIDNAGFGVFSDLSLNYTVRDNVFENNGEGGIRVPVNAGPNLTGNTITGGALGIFVDNGGVPVIRNNTIQGNQVGIRFRDLGGSQPDIQGNTISGNTVFGFQMLGVNGTVRARFNYWGSNRGPFHPSLNPTGSGDAVSDQVDFIPWGTTSGTLPIRNVSGTISGNRSWSSDTVYVVTSTVTIPSGSVLTLQPGTIVKFAAGQSMTVNGVLNAVGTPDAYVVFTSLKDDTNGGDTNGDGEATVPVPGDWQNIHIQSQGGSTGTSIRYAVLRFGGQALYVTGKLSESRLSHVFITNNQSHGIYLSNSGSLTLHRSVIGSNGGFGVYYASGNSVGLVIDSTSVDGNGSNGVYGNGNSNLRIRASQFRQNRGHGIQWINGRLDTLTQSVFESNQSTGLYLENTAGSHHIVGNSFSRNGTQGLALHNSTAEFHQIRISANQFRSNGEEGLLSSRALVLGNTFQENRYPVGTWFRVGLRYREGGGNDTNLFTGNLSNNVVTLRSSSISDTLANRFPSAITSKSYLVLTSPTVSTNARLVIEPGVNLKFAPNQNITLSGTNPTLIAIGTAEAPITFTSYRDNAAGGKTHAVSDTTTARPGDWYGVGLYSSSPASRFEHARFRYSQRGIEVYATVAENPYRNLDFRHNSTYGIAVGSGVLRIEDSRFSNIGGIGIYISGSADVTVRTSVIEHSGTGLYAGAGSAFREVSNSEIRRNRIGVQVDGGTIPQTYSGNLIELNTSHGILNNSIVPRNELTYVGNRVRDNGEEGILSSRATFIDNTFSRNRHGIGVWSRLGYRYTDNNGVDGNVFEANTYNQALALHAYDLRDTLSTELPAAIGQPVYHVMGHGSGIPGDGQLTVLPGVNIKFFPNQYLPVNGTLRAVGTAEAPIRFTSYRDHAAGGKTNLAADTVSAKAGDWGYIYTPNVNARNTKLAHVRIAYGMRGMEIYHPMDSTFSHLDIHDHSTYGIVAYNRLLIEDSRIHRAGSHGIYTPSAESDVTIRRTEIAYHTSHGLYDNSAQGGFRELSDSHIHHNQVGVYTEFTTIPASFVFNTIERNRDHGIWHNAKNDAADTLLIVGNSVIRHNAGTGLVSSRAYVTNDSIYGNAFAIGHTGQLSKSGTINELGNRYLDNVISGNTYDGVHLLAGGISGILGGTHTAETDRPQYVLGSVSIPTNDSLIVLAGSILKFNGGGLESQGRLSVRGSANRKVVFTSWRDDTYGGDSNRDSTATAPAPGNWYWIYLNETQNNQTLIRHAIIRYSTYGLYFRNNTAQVDSSSFSNSQRGLYIESGSPVIRGNDIHTNSQGIIASNYGSGTVVNLNNIWNNDEGLYNGSGGPLNAANNYWGSETGPLVNSGPDLNPGGQGNRINVASGSVTYRPFLVARTGIQIGDVTRNGTISAFDASTVLQSLVDLVTLDAAQQAAADVTGDGTISAVDASYILQYVVGRITGFPGLGKTPAADLATVFTYDASESEGMLDVRIGLENSPIGILGTELHLAYPSDLISDVEVLSAESTSDWSLQRNNQNGVLKLAYAGTSPVMDGGLIHLRFRLHEGTGGASRLLTPTRFKLNETDLTEHIGVYATSTGTDEAPFEFALEPNYPNPFNPTTQIRFTLDAGGQTTLKVYDILGREVAVLVDGVLPAGRHQILFDASRLTSGVYVYRLQSGDRVRTGKTTLLK